MTARIPVDRAGRLVLPKALRSRMHLGETDLLEAEMRGDEVVLRRVTVPASRIVRENGRAVWDAPEASATHEEIEEALLRARRERDAKASGL